MKTTKPARGRRKNTPAKLARTESRNIGDEIIDGLREAIAFERGEATGATFKPADIAIVSSRHADAEAAPEYSAAQVARIRARLRLSQSLFGRVFNVSAETAKAWEQGKAPPSGSARRLLQIAERHPEVLLELVVAK
jgi:putative transcriptional regulator